MTPDALSALRSLLMGDADVSAIVGTRVFWPELPGAETPSMPRAAIVIAASGGGGAIGFGAGHYVPLGARRIDVKCYGASFVAAMDLWGAVHAALKQMVPTEQDGMRLHSAIPESGPIVMSDADTGWPLVLSVWNVAVSEVPVEIEEEVGA